MSTMNDIGIGGESGNGAGFSGKIRRVFPFTGNGGAVHILPRTQHFADICLCQGADAVPEMVLDILAACRNGARGAAKRVWQPCDYQRADGGLD